MTFYVDSGRGFSDKRRAQGEHVAAVGRSGGAHARPAPLTSAHSTRGIWDTTEQCFLSAYRNRITQSLTPITSLFWSRCIVSLKPLYQCLLSAYSPQIYVLPAFSIHCRFTVRSISVCYSRSCLVRFGIRLHCYLVISPLNIILGHKCCVLELLENKLNIFPKTSF